MMLDFRSCSILLSAISSMGAARFVIPEEVTAADAEIIVEKNVTIIKPDHYALINRLWDEDCDGFPCCNMSYDPSAIAEHGGAFKASYADSLRGYAYLNAKIGGVDTETDQGWQPGNWNLTGLPVQVDDLDHDLYVKWKVLQEEGSDDDGNKWWATINYIFDNGTENVMPVPEHRLFDIVIELNRKRPKESEYLNDRSKSTSDVYWWFAKNEDGVTLRPFVLNVGGKDYGFAVRYKFFQNQVDDKEHKNRKVHVKFIAMDLNHVAPYIAHSLKDFIEAAGDYMTHAVPENTPERDLAEQRFSELPDLYLKSLAGGYEVYLGQMKLIQEDFFTYRCIEAGYGAPCTGTTLCCDSMGMCTRGKPSSRVCQGSTSPRPLLDD
uniref:Uncharacterized protein n=1 Tax=Odontella aurita TaxID=265563 RepID=A0A7S4HX12_9STRA|mmetsp:Transcript_16553/g.47651  ORF Transcript_16553/g.47651 Transcript_16553/m.47651 type:complete len:379 (+) Transcript_16553:158-1294(+)